MKRGYTYENRTHELSITPSAYRKTEKNENFFQENKEITQNLVSSLKDEIAHLNGEIEFLREMVKKQ
jgi:hypothetical protein